MGQTLNESEMSELLGEAEGADGSQETGSGNATLPSNVTGRDRRRVDHDVEIEMT